MHNFTCKRYISRASATSSGENACPSIRTTSRNCTNATNTPQI